MKLFIYSDVHISRTSSILPLISDYKKYTYRQNMIVKTAKWMTDILLQNDIDMIINLGDTFDQNTITSYDIDTASEFFKIFKHINKQHLVLCGNHEMLNTDYNVLRLLDNIDGIQVIDTPTVIDNLLFLPYCDYNDLDLSNYNGSEYAFLHHDIYGSKVSPTNVLDFGISQDSLGKFKKVFNGHVHAKSKFSNIINVGSITTHSFADSSESVPTCYIFDTVTQELKEFENTICPLFRKINVDSIDGLNTNLDSLDNRFKYVLHLDCAYELKEQVNSIMKEMPNLITYKITTKSIKQEDTNVKPEDIKLESNLDIKQSFKDFLSTGIELKYPMNLYNEVVGETQKSQKEINVNDMPIQDTEEVLNKRVEKCGIKVESKDVKDTNEFKNTTSANTINTLF